MSQSHAPPRSHDLLRAPVFGVFLRWRHARTALQIILLGAAIFVVTDGLFGPQLAPENLAGVLPWVHWRGFVALALLLVGNLFCMACPFMLPRRLAKKIFPGRAHWPKALRTKWLALALLFLFLWAYEAFDLWASPWLTAWLTLAYFAAAFAVDGIYRGAAFCKYVCPIGHFNFVNSLVSPTEVRIRDPEVCGACRTRECITGVFEKSRALAGDGAVAPLVGGRPALPAAGGEPAVIEGGESRSVPLPTLEPGRAARRMEDRGKLLQNGCELWLYQEKKWGNMDCTFCMECILACPYDNVGILSRPPAQELWEDPRRAGVGRFSQRPDLAALAVFLTFAGFMNAFGMVTPVYALEAWMGGILGIRSGPILVGILFLAGMILLPLLLVAAAAWGSRALSGARASLLHVATWFGYALVPVGFGMWVAHYLYHFLTGALVIIPAFQEYLSDLGFPILGPPAWNLGPMVPDAWLLPMELLFLEMGSLVSLVVAFRIARRELGPGGRALRAALPWGGLILALALAGAWLLVQPMEMRGILMGS